MTFRRPTMFVLAAAFAAPLGAQAFNLRDLLTEFLREGITLAPPQAPFPSHEAHFIAEDSPQFRAVQQFSAGIANQLSSFPIASSAGGFTYRFDPALGVFTRSADSFGPVYAERADTIGKGKFNLGVNYSHFTFDRIDNLALRDGELRLVFTHQDVNRDQNNLQPFFEGDIITARLFLKLESDITAFVISYGVSDRLDVGVALPLVRVDLEAQTDATIQRIATSTTAPDIHRFVNGGTSESFRQSGSASGVGDVVLRGKFQLLRGDRGGLSIAEDLRLPTGEERDLLGTGATQAKTFVVGSLKLGGFSPHVNAGYTWSSGSEEGAEIPDEISYTAGFDWAMSPRMTLAVDVLGRDFLSTRRVRVVDTTFQANTNPAGPPNIVTATFPRLVAEQGDSNSLLGSIGLKINPFGNFLLTVNGLFRLNNEGLQDDFAPLVAVDYSF
ncbi:MAG TPA: transporter [Thermoanaerobaculia bacterium]|nr:transporter [Thermoanaerobaculia bacterium]